MKKTKLLAATAMLLLTSCSPKVVTNIVRTYPDIIPADSVYVIGLGEKVAKFGWKSLTSKESGKIGGMMAARRKNKGEK